MLPPSSGGSLGRLNERRAVRLAHSRDSINAIVSVLLLMAMLCSQEGEDYSVSVESTCQKKHQVAFLISGNVPQVYVKPATLY